MQHDLTTHNYADPNPWTALELDQSTFLDPAAKAALLKGNASFSRRYILPFLRPAARLSIVLVKVLRCVLPNRLASSWLLHSSIVWGLRNFVSPEANYLILRHFHIGSQILAFLADNITPDIRRNPLTPHTIEDLRANMFLEHDLNIYNFITCMNSTLRTESRQTEAMPLAAVNFDAITPIDPKLHLTPARWHNFLDLQTAIEFYTPLYALFLSDHDFWRASNSLQLDETMAIYVARLLDRESIIGLVNNRHPLVPISTLEAGYRLMLHGLDAENLYGFICHMKAQQGISSSTA